MILSTRYEMRPEHLYIEGSGDFSVEQACRLFTEAMEFISGKDVRRILMDARQVKGQPGTLEYFRYGEFIAAEIVRFSRVGKIGPLRIAYLALPPLLDPGRFTQTVATNRGATVIATDDMDEAMHWLRIPGGG